MKKVNVKKRQNFVNMVFFINNVDINNNKCMLFAIFSTWHVFCETISNGFVTKNILLKFQKKKQTNWMRLLPPCITTSMEMGRRTDIASYAYVPYGKAPFQYAVLSIQLTLKASSTDKPGVWGASSH